MTASQYFWQNKTLQDFTSEEWDLLCDGCGQCCQYKLEDEESGDLYLTNVVCRFLNPDSCRCNVYEERHNVVPTCVQLTPENVPTLEWIPPTCGYKLIAEGKPLPNWHPLISGNIESVHEAGISVRGRVISESKVDMDNIKEFVIKE
jgi:uncharacterized cysteine cluster protein YcgN (CxxCxxCC family)